ncbi:MAG: transcriptional regulator [Sneathiella sp.]|jgi:DNA-binding MarR family transcriptional regulator|uniref:MarR family winged helix-turn-helix transcriptional regulator n=1 Tax=Sneathiella sp. TaxID=1964365 RepID=UPI000C6578E5|nr:MarR family transcriptional regulator [Sneathiella sp.]MAL77819.1 transcriptional regulator [Sneathiella sp.]|tara:strand:+ start:826 stop:1326 length:501 start_codon:yes stop_codon:yes gene_type:complete
MSKSEGTAPPQKRTPASDERFHLSNRLLFRLFKTANIMHTAGTKWTSELKMTSQQWSVVGALARPGYEEGVSVNELSKFLMVSRQNVNGLLMRLEQHGISQRVADPRDGRAKLVQLTPEGWILWRQLIRRISEFYDVALASFTTEELVQFQYFIDKLQRNLGTILK